MAERNCASAQDITRTAQDEEQGLWQPSRQVLLNVEH